MKLSVPAPPGWTRQQVADGELLRADHRALELLILPVEGAKVDARAWFRSALLHRTRQNERELTNPRTQPFTTKAGWSAVLIEADIGTESRLVAYFTFLDLVATAIAICGDRDIPGWRDEVLDMLSAATPDFGDDVVCLAGLLGGPPPVERVVPPVSRALWQRTFSHGDAILVLEDAPESGFIRCGRGRGATRTVRDLFATLERDQPGCVELGVSADGEYYAFAVRRDGQTQTVLAIVFGDERYSRIESMSRDPAMFDVFSLAARDLVYQASLGFGAGRIRPYYYEPPRDWIGLSRPGRAVWLAPTCGREFQQLRIFDARPPDSHELISARRFENLASEFLVSKPKGPAIYYTAHDLECRVHVYTGTMRGGKQLKVLDGVVNDEHYCYPLRIGCEPHLLEASMHTFEDVVRTMVPLPAPNTAVPADSNAFAYWVT